MHVHLYVHIRPSALLVDDLTASCKSSHYGARFITVREEAKVVNLVLYATAYQQPAEKTPCRLQRQSVSFTQTTARGGS